MLLRPVLPPGLVQAPPIKLVLPGGYVQSGPFRPVLPGGMAQVASGGGFDPETLGDLLLWQRNSTLGPVSDPVIGWENSANAGPDSVSSAGGSSVSVTDFLGPKLAACQSLADSFLQSNSTLGWSGEDFYMAAVLATVSTPSSDGSAHIISVSGDQFEVTIDGSDLISVTFAGAEFPFTDATFPGSNTLFLLEVWRIGSDTHCALNGVDSAVTVTDGTVAADSPISIGNVSTQTGIALGEMLFYQGMVSDRAAIRAYLNSIFFP